MNTVRNLKILSYLLDLFRVNYTLKDVLSTIVKRKKND